MSDQTQPTTENSPALLRYAAIALCVVGGGSALPWMYLSLGRFGGFAWGLFGFELLVLLGAIMTILVCVGKVRVGGAMPLALACFAGTLLVASVFGIHVNARSLIGENHPDVAPWVNRTLMLYLILIAGLSLVAVLDVYRRTPRSWGLAIRALIFLIPVLGAGVYFQRAGLPSMSDPSGELSVVRMIAAILGGIAVGIFLSVGGHFLIRSFEVALPEKTGSENA